MDDLGQFRSNVPLWNKELGIPLLNNLKIAPGTAEYVQLQTNSTPCCEGNEVLSDYNPSGIPLYQPSYPSDEKALRCSHCDVTFSAREELVTHYGLDWHRMNVKRSVQGFSNSVSYQQFTDGTLQKQEEGKPDEDCLSEEDDGDELDDEAGEDEIAIGKKPRVYFVNSENEVISIYRVVLQHKKTVLFNEKELIHRVSVALNKLYWTIILVGGGHFAAAVYKGPEVVVHKTFHSYTVRANQGGSQSSRDNKNATSHPKSAGASLRRYNEQAHNQHVQEVLEEWKDHIRQCDLIFYRCPKSNNQLLFGGQPPVLTRNDERLRTVPFPSKKPTFAEVKKIHKNLSQIYVHGNLEKVRKQKTEKEKVKRVTASTSKTKEDKSSKRLTKDEIAVRDTREAALLCRSSSEDDVGELTASFKSFGTTPINPFGSSVEDSRTSRKRSTEKMSKENSVKANNSASADAGQSSDESSAELQKIENFLYTACRTGNLCSLQAFIQFSQHRDFTDISDAIPNDVIEAVVSMGDAFNIFAIKFGIHEKTPLHVAAENAHKKVIWWLLEEGFDPSVKNGRKETPYTATKVKEARNQFRRFMAAYPHKYDYAKADIAGPLSLEKENEQKKKQAEKKKQQKKAKQDREEERRNKEEEIRREEEEKRKYLSMSDREKRALAAEKRLLAATKAKEVENAVVLRCFQCAKDLTNIVPFEYCDFKFCSTVCVKEHRTKGKLK